MTRTSHKPRRMLTLGALTAAVALLAPAAQARSQHSAAAEWGSADVRLATTLAARRQGAGTPADGFRLRDRPARPTSRSRSSTVCWRSARDV
jgi:hypothetical protein